MRKTFITVFLVAIITFSSNYLQTYSNSDINQIHSSSKVSSELKSMYVDSESEIKLFISLKDGEYSEEVNQEDIESDLKLYRNEVSNFMTAFVDRVVDSFDFEYEMIYSSKTLPYISIITKYSNIQNLILNPEVLFISYNKDYDISSDYLTKGEDATDISDLSYYQSTKIGPVKDSTNVSGDGVTIGFIEEGKIFTDEDNFLGKDIRMHGFNDGPRDHATSVSMIAAGHTGIAHEANIRAFGLGTFTGMTNGTMLSRMTLALDFMVDEEVDIVNMSISTFSCQEIFYSDFTRVVDHFISIYKVPVVLSSGNNPCYQNLIASQFAYAHNAIIVGATDVNGEQLAHYSSYKEVRTGHPDDLDINALYEFDSSIPDLVAPGGALHAKDSNGDFYPIEFESECAYTTCWSWGIDVKNYDEPYSLRGTSFAAPIVTGSIALMMDYEPLLKGKPSLIKSILTASANINSISVNDINTLDNYSNKVGAGLLDLSKAFDIIDNLSYTDFNGGGDSTVVPLTFKLDLNANEEIRFSISYEYYQSEDNDLIVNYHDLTFDILDVNNNLISINQRVDVNQKIIYFTPPTNGIYTFKLKNYNSGEGHYISEGSVSWDLPIPVYDEGNTPPPPPPPPPPWW